MMRVHAIIIALNEEDFILETIKPLYSVCSGISVITQYDRDYYGKSIEPDSTVDKVLRYPDPTGKIHLVVRKYNDETASRNHEMKSILVDASKGIMSHGVLRDKIETFHLPPDYFLICDADEIYDIESVEAIFAYLEVKKPRGMRVSAYEYIGNWNRRIQKEKYVHHQFGFIKAGLFFEQRRVINWNESRINRAFEWIAPKRNIGTKLFGFIDCPIEIGMFHHGGYVRRSKEKLREKMLKHSHLEAHKPEFLENVLAQELEYVDFSKLPINIQKGTWPTTFFEK